MTEEKGGVKKELGKVQKELKRLEIRGRVEKAKAEMASRDGASSRRGSVQALKEKKVVQNSTFIDSPSSKKSESEPANIHDDCSSGTEVMQSAGNSEFDDSHDATQTRDHDTLEQYEKGKREDVETHNMKEKDIHENIVQSVESNEEREEQVFMPDNPVGTIVEKFKNKEEDEVEEKPLTHRAAQANQETKQERCRESLV